MNLKGDRFKMEYESGFREKSINQIVKTTLVALSTFAISYLSYGFVQDVVNDRIDNSKVADVALSLNEYMKSNGISEEHFSVKEDSLGNDGVYGDIGGQEYKVNYRDYDGDKNIYLLPRGSHIKLTTNLEGLYQAVLRGSEALKQQQIKEQGAK